MRLNTLDCEVLRQYGNGEYIDNSFPALSHSLSGLFFLFPLFQSHICVKPRQPHCNHRTSVSTSGSKITLHSLICLRLPLHPRSFTALQSTVMWATKITRQHLCLWGDDTAVPNTSSVLSPPKMTLTALHSLSSCFARKVTVGVKCLADSTWLGFFLLIVFLSERSEWIRQLVLALQPWSLSSSWFIPSLFHNLCFPPQSALREPNLHTPLFSRLAH